MIGTITGVQALLPVTNFLKRFQLIWFYWRSWIDRIYKGRSKMERFWQFWIIFQFFSTLITWIYFKIFLLFDWIILFEKDFQLLWFNFPYKYLPSDMLSRWTFDRNAGKRVCKWNSIKLYDQFNFSPKTDSPNSFCDDPSRVVANKHMTSEPLHRRVFRNETDVTVITGVESTERNIF